MGKRRGGKIQNKGSLNQQDIWIEKRFAKMKKQEASPVANSMFASTAHNYHSHVPASASVVAPIANGGWSAMQPEEMAGGDQLPGYIFMCNGKTKPDCFKYRVFGLPAARMDVVAKIRPRTILFLFDFDLKILYGVFVAASNGLLGLEPSAFGGKFSAQVRFEVFKDCLPLPEIAFKHAIKDNYQGGFKFRQELSNKQVNDLIPLFRTVAARPSVPVAPLMPNVVSPMGTPPPGFEEYAQQQENLRSRDDQSVAGLQLTPAALAPDLQRGQDAAPSAPYEPHGSAAHKEPFQPAVQSQHLLLAGEQPYCDLYQPAEYHQAYVPEEPALPLQDPSNRYATVQKDSEIAPQFGKTNNYYYHSFATTYPPAQPVAVAGSYAPIQAHASTPSQFPAPTRITSSSLSLSASYWVGVASQEDPKQAMTAYWAGMDSKGPNQSMAAYWAGVASRDPNQAMAAHRTGVAPEGLNPNYYTSTGLGDDHVPVTFAGSTATYTNT